MFFHPVILSFFSGMAADGINFFLVRERDMMMFR